MEERNSIYAKNKETLSSSTISKVSQSGREFNNKLRQEHRTLNNELNTLSKNIEIYHKSKALTQKEYEEYKKEIDSIKTTLRETYEEMEKHGNLTAGVEKSLATLPDVNEIDMNVDTNQSSPKTILIDLKSKLQQMREREKNLNNVGSVI
ncbi:MAG: hypothetical protein GY782_05770 [Gammaproteobacteria bacterium]|nr:hypothetical protein [Gammaproteobacteria bacterium]